MDITPLADRPVSQLSGGERARVLVARALAQVCTPGGCYTIMPYHKRFSVEPYGIFWLKDRPLSPGARTVLSALRAASERKMRRLAEPGADTENHIGLANNHI